MTPASRRPGRVPIVMDGIDGLVFTAGVGEHAAPVSADIVSRLSWLGAAIDPQANARHGPKISSSKSAIACYVIPTNEELIIARHEQAVVLHATVPKSSAESR
jgi:acetate kinase